MNKLLVALLSVTASFGAVANQTTINNKVHAHIEIADHCNFAGWKQEDNSLTVRAFCGQNPHYATITGDGINNIKNVIVSDKGSLFSHPITISIFSGEELGIGKVSIDMSDYGFWSKDKNDKA